eukprot:m.104438 g.104438  ORF g.104438 m.104438 type:complete len:119 (+) comp15078_c0_seq2:347-703(+)
MFHCSSFGLVYALSVQCLSVFLVACALSLCFPFFVSISVSVPLLSTSFSSLPSLYCASRSALSFSSLLPCSILHPVDTRAKSFVQQSRQLIHNSLSLLLFTPGSFLHDLFSSFVSRSL